MNKIAIFLVSMLLISAAQASAIPPPFSALYKVKKSIIPLGEACITLTHKQGKLKYEFKFESAILDFHETSHLGVVNGRFHSVKFQHREKDKKIVSVFNRQKGVVTTTRTGKQDKVVKMPNNKDVWDLLSIQLKLISDLSNSTAQTNFKYHVVNKRGKIKPYKIKVKNMETVKTKMGDYKARRVVVENKDRQFWFAPELDYMPVQLEIDGVSLKLLGKSCER